MRPPRFWTPSLRRLGERLALPLARVVDRTRYRLGMALLSPRLSLAAATTDYAPPPWAAQILARGVRGAAIWDDIWNGVQAIWDFFVNNAQRLVDWFRARGQDVFSWIANNLQSLINDFWNFVAGKFSDVRGLAETIWGFFTDNAQRLVDWFTARGQDIFSWIANNLQSLINYFWNFVAGKFSDVSAFFGQVIGGVGQIVHDVGSFFVDNGHRLLDWFIGNASRLYGWIIDRMREVQLSLYIAFGNFSEWIHGRWKGAENQWDQITTWADQTLSGLNSFVSKWGAGGPVGLITGIVGTGGEWTWGKISDPDGPVLGTIADLWDNNIQPAFADLWDTIKDGLDNIWKLLAGAWTAFAEFAQRNIIEPLGNAFRWVIDGLTQPFIGFIRRFLPAAPAMATETLLPIVLDPTDSVTNVLQFFGPFAAMTIGGELIHPLKSLGLGQLSAMVWDASNFQNIVGSYIYPYMDAAVRTPMYRQMRRNFRTTLPGMGELGMMFAKHEIQRDLFREAMAQNGLADLWLDVYERYIYRDPRLSELVRIAQISYPPEIPDPFAWDWLGQRGLRPAKPSQWWWTYKLAKAGYEPVDIRTLPAIGEVAAVRREQTLWLDQIERMYREGWMTEAEARLQMMAARMTDSAIEFRLSGAKLERRYEISLERYQAIEARFTKGIANRATTESRLATLGMDAERIQTTIDLWLAKRSARNETPESASVFRPIVTAAVALRREGLTTDATFRAILTLAGISPEALADYSLALNLDIRREEADLVRRALEAAYTKGRITEAQFIDGLVAAGFDRQRAELLSNIIELRRPVAVVKPAYETDVGELRVDRAIDLWWANVFSDAQLRGELIALQMPAALADAQVGSLKAQRLRKAVPKPPLVTPYYDTPEGRLRVAAAREQYHDNVISRSRLVDALRGYAMSASLAESVAIYEDARKEAPAPAPGTPEPAFYQTDVGKLRVKEAIEDYRDGAIAKASLVSRLQGYAMPAALAAAVADYEEARLA